MSTNCPRCGELSPSRARYCRRCGLVLEVGPDGVRGAGRVTHPEPLPAPEGYVAIDGATGLWALWQPVGGGRRLIGTEPLEVLAFNGGYDLADVALRIDGHDETGSAIISIVRELAQWARGQTVRMEVASWELPGPVDRLSVRLDRAAFGPVT